MRKAILLLAIVSMIWSCQKKEYPRINNPQAESYSRSKTIPTEKPAQLTTQAAPNQEILSASIDGGIEEVVGVAAPVRAESVSAPTVAVVKKAPARMSLKEKIIAKTIQKKIGKALSPAKAKEAKAQIDTISLLSLIASGAGLLVLLLGSGAGLLLGLIGLVLGFVGLGRIKRGDASSSSRIFAILGIVFGGLIVLLGLYVILLVASYGFV